MIGRASPDAARRGGAVRLLRVTPDAKTGVIGAHDVYMRALLVVLCGYALLGKGFAYLGVPPLFIGEIALAWGLLVLARTGCWIAVLASGPSVFLVVLSFWVILRAAPFIGAFGVDAVRDSVIVGYGLFAFIVAALLIEKPRRLEWILDAYGRFAWLYGIIGGWIFLISAGALAEGLIVTGSGIRLPHVRPGEAALHLSGAAIFMLLGFRRVSLPWMLALLTSIALVTVSRGAMLACLMPIAVASVVAPRTYGVGSAVALVAAVLMVAYFADLAIPISGDRFLGPEQIINNLESIFSSSSASNLDGTKLWRLRWWQTIRDYTIDGPYFWTGKGFGINLAESDGFTLGHEVGELRSPHNAQMTILARAGVPGLTLWAITILSWFAMLTHGFVTARRRGHASWANLFLWNGCYAAAILIHASFDVALEGPMVGIWFWSLFGLGVGSCAIYRAMTAPARPTLQSLEPAAPPPPAAPYR
jgi:hypothetical protein